MSVGFFALLMILSVMTPAMALDECFQRSVGSWRGPVANDGQLQSMDTEFHLDAEGQLAGGYHIADPVTFDGTLSGFHPTGHCEADFTWTDRYGTGTVHIRFEPDQGRFTGTWGFGWPIPGNIFNGNRSGLSS